MPKAKKVEVKRKGGKSSSEYNADSLSTLPYPLNVRHRPATYIGSKEEYGVRRIWKEIVDNACDEANAGHGKLITVVYDSKTCTYTVADEGRGVPSGYNKKEKKTGFEIVYCTLHGGGKFDNSNYGTSSGLNGIGCAATNATSSRLQVWSHNEGSWKTQVFKAGVAVTDIKSGAPDPEFAKKKKGTVVQWIPDTEIFGDHKIDIGLMRETCAHLSMLYPGVSIALTVNGKTKVYKSTNGLLDLIYGTEEQQKTALIKPFHFQKPHKIDVAVVWHDDDTQHVWSYVNASHTPEEGTHVQGVRTAILEALKGELSDKDKLDPKFFLKGMRLALNWRMLDPVYASQTKDKLTNSEVITEIKKLVLPEFTEFLKKNKKLVSVLIDRAKKFQKNEEKFIADNKAVKTIKLVDPSARGILPGKFQPAPGYKPDEKELILVEGDSCGGSAAKSRMPWQEILPLRGKIPNPERTPFARFFENAEVCNIFTALGALPNDPYDSKKRRVGKVSFLPDADPDGKHIGSELIALFVRYLPDWIQTGHVFHIDAPLYVGGHRGVKKYGNTRDEVLAQFAERDRKSVLLTRMKGWGECLTKSVKIQTQSGLLKFGSVLKTQPLGWSTLDTPITVLDKDGVARKVTKVFKKRAVTLRLRIGGRTIKATKNHPFLVCADGALVWKTASDLRIDDVVIANRSVTGFGKSPKFSEDWKKPLLSNTRLTIGRVPTRMTVELARLLGYLVADGGGSSKVHTGEYLGVALDIKHCFDLSFPDCEARIEKLSDKNMYEVHLTKSKYFVEFLHSLGYKKGCTAHTKDVPDAILSASRECVASFIQGVMESDGYFGAVSAGHGRKYDTIEHYTASERLSTSMTVLFSMFGIHAPYKEEENVFNPFKGEYSNRKGYKLTILGENIDTYLREIGIVSKDKCARLLKYLRGSKRVRNTNTDVLLGVKDAVNDARCKFRIGGKSTRRYNVNGKEVELSIGFNTGAANITYQELQRNASAIDDIAAIAPGIADTLRYCVKHRPVFVRVESIKRTTHAEYVGDIEVPVSHSYIANGLVVHNCQSDDMHEIAMNPTTRNVKQYQLNDGDSVIVNNVMGDEVEHRKVLLGIKGGV